MELAELLDLAKSHRGRRGLIPVPEFVDSVRDASAALRALPSKVRPKDSQGSGGGLVFPRAKMVAIIPDLHARTELLPSFLGSRLPGDAAEVAELLVQKRLDILCLGDILHSEGHEAERRWRRILNDVYEKRSESALLCPEMDFEMGGAILALDLVMKLIVNFPGQFFCLKGNHDNMGNFDTHGDSQFFKYALEGAMGAAWFTMRYGPEALEALRGYELELPLVATGKESGFGFCASHAEPAFAMRGEDIIEYRTRPDIVRALIWTPDFGAAENAAAATLDGLLSPGIAPGRSRWISGHRPIAGAFNVRSEGRFVQLHNPSVMQAAILSEPGSVRTSGGTRPRQKRSELSGILDIFRIKEGGGELEPLASIGLDPQTGED